MGYEKLSAMLRGLRTGAQNRWFAWRYSDRPGIQQALDLGADGVLIPYINSPRKRAGVSCTKYPTAGTRSVYFPQRSMNKAGLLGYAGNANNISSWHCRSNRGGLHQEHAGNRRVSRRGHSLLGQNDLCCPWAL